MCVFLTALVLEDDIDSLESQRQSFIVKVWVEDPVGFDQTNWRGHITHVPSGERMYIQDLNGITRFIGKYLRQMGVQVKLRQQLSNRLKRLFRPHGKSGHWKDK